VSVCANCVLVAHSQSALRMAMSITPNKFQSLELLEPTRGHLRAIWGRCCCDVQRRYPPFIQPRHRLTQSPPRRDALRIRALFTTPKYVGCEHCPIMVACGHFRSWCPCMCTNDDTHRTIRSFTAAALRLPSDTPLEMLKTFSRPYRSTCAPESDRGPCCTESINIIKYYQANDQILARFQA